MIWFTLFFLMLGIVYENKRLGSPWGYLFLKIFLAFLFGVFVLTKKNLGDEEFFQMWVNAAIWIFAFISIVIHDDKVIPKLTEGITLIQSLAIIYFIADMHLHEIGGFWVNLVLIITGLMSIYTIYHAFSYKKHSRNSRLILSLWSAVVMCLFAVEHIYNVYHLNLDRIEEWQGFLIVNLQYFLLGISLMYMIMNTLMLVVYLPGNGQFYGVDHRREIREYNDKRIENYSEAQIPRFTALIAIFITSSFFYLNYHYQFFSRTTAIWLIFWLLPIGEWVFKRGE